MNGPCSDTCILIPTYNNAGTVGDVISRCRASGLPIFVVDDGSDDATAGVLAAAGDIQVIRHPKNKGKGVALKTGFIAARKAGYSYVITIDADGQHFPEDIPALMQRRARRTIVVGSRNIQADGMPSGSTFANKFSNFWFTVQTARRLPDTQTGYRLYPLNDLPCLGLLTARYEAELTLLVFSPTSARSATFSESACLTPRFVFWPLSMAIPGCCFKRYSANEKADTPYPRFPFPAPRPCGGAALRGCGPLCTFFAKT